MFHIFTLISLTSLTQSTKPNILFILQDDFGWYDSGIHAPNAEPFTPAMTKLAKEGVVLDNHYVHWHCSPTRRSFITGRLPLHHGEFLSGVATDDIDLRWTWISQKLKQAGYQNYWVGKGHTGYKSWNHLPVNRGFDFHFGFLGGYGNYYHQDQWQNTAPVTNFNTYSTDYYGQLSIDLISKHDTSKPFFLYLPWQAVHTPYDLPPNKINSTRRPIFQMIYDADQWMDKLVQLLKTKGLWDNTLIVYSSDNGGVTQGLNYPLRGEKHTSWEGAMRVNAFVSGGLIPKNLRGTINTQRFHVVDWYPTFCGLAGVDSKDDSSVAPEPIDPLNPSRDIWGQHAYPGIDGLDIWKYLMTPQKESIRQARQGFTLSREVLLHDKWKLVVAQPSPKLMNANNVNNGWKQLDYKWAPSSDEEFGCNAYNNRTHFRPCLFDLSADPNEHKNLAEAHPDIMSSLWQMLNETWLGKFTSRSPAQLVGKCNKMCAKKKWGWIVPSPQCGIPGCSNKKVFE